MGYIKDRAQKVYGTEPKTMDELADCVIKLINSYKDSWGNMNPRVVGFEWDLQYSSKVSNSHSAPEDGTTNWRGEKGIPTGYPGFVGRVWVRFAENNEIIGYGSDPFAITLTHTGSGGVGHGGMWTWDYKIFLSDWPEIENLINQQRCWNLIAGEDFKFSHKFLWGPITGEYSEQYDNWFKGPAGFLR